MSEEEPTDPRDVRAAVINGLLVTFVTSVSFAGFLVDPIIGFLTLGLTCFVVALLYAVSE